MIRQFFSAFLVIVFSFQQVTAQWTSLGLTSSVGLTNLHLDTPSNILYVGDIEGFWFYDIDADQWTDVTEPGWIGRTARSITAHPDIPGRIVTGRVNAWFKGYMEYTDDWGATNNFVYESTGGVITDVKYCPSQPDQMFACGWNDIAPGELLKSEDGGETWTPITNYWHENMTEIAVHPTDENIVYVSGDAKITKTTDGGTTWVETYNGLPSGLGVYCVSIDTFDTDVLLCSNDNGIYKSTDAGTNWSLANNYQVKRFAFNPIYENYVAAITFEPYTVLLSSDRGDSWIDVTNAYPGTIMSDLVFSSDGNDLYVVEQDEIYKITIDDLSVGDLYNNWTELHCYPNPIDNQATISFKLHEEVQSIHIEIFNVLGKKVKTIPFENTSIGDNKGLFDFEDMESGYYFLNINAEMQISEPIKIIIK